MKLERSETPRIGPRTVQHLASMRQEVVDLIHKIKRSPFKDSDDAVDWLDDPNHLETGFDDVEDDLEGLPEHFDDVDDNLEVEDLGGGLIDYGHRRRGDREH